MNTNNNNSDCFDMNGNPKNEDKKTTLNDLNFFKDIKQEDLIRGNTPDDIEQRCYDLCKEFIGGTWSHCTIDDLTVKRISGGLTNQIYYVGIKDSVDLKCNSVYKNGNEPREVAVKLYQKKHLDFGMGNFERLNDTIITTIISELNIGPKVYGIFEDGVIQEYYKVSWIL